MELTTNQNSKWFHQTGAVVTIGAKMGRAVKSEEALKLPELLSRCNGIREIRAWQTGNLGIKLVIETASKWPGPFTLDVYDGNMDSVGYEHIASLLQSRKVSVLRLELSLTPEAISRLASASTNNLILREFSLVKRGHQDTRPSLLPLITALKTSGLKTFHCSFDLEHSGGEVEAIAKDLDEKLTTLELPNNNFGMRRWYDPNEWSNAMWSNEMVKGKWKYEEKVGSIQGIANMLTSPNASLTCLNLAGTQLFTNGYKILLNALSQSRCLKSLAIGTNPIVADPFPSGHMAMDSLIEALYRNYSLEKLQILGGFASDDKYLERFLPLLKQHSLTHLRLRSGPPVINNHPVGFKISEDVASQLADFLKEADCPLQLLDLYGNKMTEGGTKKVFESLKQNTSLTLLDIEATMEDAPPTDLIVEIMQKNHTLTSLNYGVKGQTNTDSWRPELSPELQIKCREVELINVCLERNQFLQQVATDIKWGTPNTAWQRLTQLGVRPEEKLVEEEPESMVETEARDA